MTIIDFLILRKPVNQVAGYKERSRIKRLCFLASPAGGVYLILLNCYGLVFCLTLRIMPRSQTASRILSESRFGNDNTVYR